MLVQEEVFQALRFARGLLTGQIFPTNQHQSSADLFQGDVRIFPPELRCVQTYESQGYEAQRQMTFQRHIAASLEVGQADFALGDAEHVFHIPAHERGQEHAPQGDPPWYVGDEVFRSDSRGTVNGWHCAGANATGLILPALLA